MAGIVRISKGVFRPKILVTKPQHIFPIKPPTHISDATQLASSIVIGPVGNGEFFSDVNKIMLGLAHPQTTPYPNKSKFTVV